MKPLHEPIAKLVRIRGRVQGVWYRGWTVDQARRLGLAGWVRNRANGTVEALFSGPPAAVEAMIALCRQGPSAARVEAVEATDAAPITGSEFVQRPSE